MAGTGGGTGNQEQLDIAKADTELSHLPCTQSTSFFFFFCLQFAAISVTSPIRPRGFDRRRAKEAHPLTRHFSVEV